MSVFFIAYFLFSNLIFNIQLPTTGKNKKATNKIEQNNKPLEKIYVVKEGDDLWHIAEKEYGSGYNAYDIAVANNLTDLNTIEVGSKLIIPSIAPKQPTVGEVSNIETKKVTITQTQYTVQPGDDLWKIAEAVYGDGNGWIKIAHANNIIDPNILLEGSILLIPR